MQMQMEIQFDKWQTAIKQTINGISMAANGCSGVPKSFARDVSKPAKMQLNELKRWLDHVINVEKNGTDDIAIDDLNLSNWI